LAFHWYLESLHQGVLRYCVERGWDAQLLNSDTLPLLRTGDIDGIVSMLAVEQEHPVTKFVLNLDSPVVELSRAFSQKTTWGRTPEDCELIARRAAQFLKERPVKSFVFVAHYPWWNHNIRSAVFQKELSTENHPVQTVFLSDLGGAEHAIAPLGKFLASLPSPVGVFGSVDEAARITVEAAETAGLNIPRDVVVLGFGNRELVSKWATVPVSSITIDYEQWAWEATALLGDMIDGTASPGTVRAFPPSGIIERRSTGLDPVNEQLCVRAITHMRTHFAKPLSVSALAARLGVSKATLERSFDRELGCGVAKKSLLLRIEHAKALLQQGLKTEVVSRECGFRSYRAFIAAFHRECGMPPGTYAGRR
jgi:LacI family transcriptional regulator